MFPSLNEYLQEWNELTIRTFDAIKLILVEDLKIFENPFLAKSHNLSEDIPGLQKELINLHYDKFHRQLYSTASLEEFWTSVKKDKTIITAKAMTILLPFTTTYLCEQGFSVLTVIKTKVRKRLDPGHDMHIALSKIEPCIEDIMKEKLQFHQSH